MTEDRPAIERPSIDHFRLLELYVDLYKHHLDWFLKAIIVSLAFAGTAASMAFKSEPLNLSKHSCLQLSQ